MTPRRIFRTVAVAEALTWALLLGGMYLKYVPETTDVGVRVGGMLHGIVFLGYCLTTLLVAVDQRWSTGRTVLGLVASVPPFATVAFERYAQRRGLLAGSWRLAVEQPSGPVERVSAWLVRSPARGALVGAAAVAVLTGVALLVGPPTG